MVKGGSKETSPSDQRSLRSEGRLQASADHGPRIWRFDASRAFRSARHQQAGVVQFAVRNPAASNQLKEAGAEELAGMWGAARRLKVGELEDEYVAAEEALDDPALTLAERNQLRNLKRQLIRDMNEMCGHLLTRTAVAVESPLPLRHEVLGFDWEKWRDQLEHPRDSAPAPAVSSEPDGPGSAAGPAPADAPVPTVEPERPAAAQWSAISRSMSWGPGTI